MKNLFKIALLSALLLISSVTAFSGAMMKRWAGAVCVASSLGTFPSVSNAVSSRNVADIPTSGLFFKDALKISSFRDPKLPGIEIYLADFERPLTEKITGDFFNDPSSSSLSCVQTAPVTKEQVKSLGTNKEGEEIFKESKNLFLKSVNVNRIFDKETNTVLYVLISS